VTSGRFVTAAEPQQKQFIRTPDPTSSLPAWTVLEGTPA
jgi:hypothetical protein